MQRWGWGVALAIAVQAPAWAGGPWNAMREGWWQEARISWEQEAKQHGEHDESHGWLAVLMAMRGEHALAREKALRVIDGGFNDWLGHWAIAISAGRQKKTEESNRHYKLAMSSSRFGFLDNDHKQAFIAVARAVGDARPYLTYGEEKMKGDRPWQGVFPLEVAAQVAPQDPHIQAILAQAYLKDHKPELAITSLREAVGIKPHDLDLQLLLAETLVGQGHFFHPEMVEEAHGLFLTLIKLHPKPARAYAGLGKALDEKSQDKDAFKAYQKAVELDPDLIEVHKRLVWLYRFEDRLDVGIYSLQHLIRLEPKDPEHYVELAGLVRRTKGPKAAIPILQKGLKAVPGNADMEKALWEMEREK